jgi:hypothetical protein
LSARQVFLARLVPVLSFGMGDIVVGEMCAQEICCYNCLVRVVAPAGVMPVIVNERDLKPEPALAVLAVEAGSGEEFVAVLGLVVGSISAAAAVVAAAED